MVDRVNVSVHVGGFQKFWGAVAPPLGKGIVNDLLKTPVALPSGKGIVHDPLVTLPSPISVTVLNLDTVGQTVWSNVRRAAGKISSIVSRLSRSLKVNGIDTDRLLTCDFLLVIHNSHGPISWSVQSERRFRSKKCKLFPARVFKILLMGFALEFCDGKGTQN